MEIRQPASFNPEDVELVVGTTPILGGTNGKVLYDNNGILGEETLVTGVSSVSNSDGTLTISPTTGAVVASLTSKLAPANTLTGKSLQYLRVNAGETAVEYAAVSSPTGANPTASVGLTAVNGSAATFMRSDGAPALDQTIAPTWTGKHIFQKTTTPIQIGYDGSNYLTITPGSAGSTTFALTGTSPTFAFSQGVTVNGQTTIQSTSTSVLTFNVQSITGQTADIQNWTRFDGFLLLKVDKNGSLWSNNQTYLGSFTLSDYAAGNGISLQVTATNVSTMASFSSRYATDDRAMIAFKSKTGPIMYFGTNTTGYAFYNGAGDASHPILSMDNGSSGTSGGEVGVNGAFVASTQFTVFPAATSYIGQTISALSGQTADLQRWNVNSTTLAKIDASGNLTSPIIKSTAPQTTYTGSVSGTAVWSMPFQGSSYKKFVINMAALNDAGGTITFPTAFTKTPYVYGDSAATAVSTASTTTFTIAAAATITGNVIVEGY